MQRNADVWIAGLTVGPVLLHRCHRRGLFGHQLGWLAMRTIRVIVRTAIAVQVRRFIGALGETVPSLAAQPTLGLEDLLDSDDSGAKPWRG